MHETSWLSVILLGVIEGATEFLPVSSTGHLLIAQQWLGHRSDLFNTVIQCGTVLALVGALRSRLQSFWQSRQDAATHSYILKLMAAFVITGIGGLALKKMGMKLPENLAPVAWATFVGGVVFLLAEVRSGAAHGGDFPTWRVAVLCGFAQLVAAALPGTSRSGITILVAWLAGMRREKAVEFSFLLGIPTLLAAGGYELFKALRAPEPFTEPAGILLLGTAVAALTAFVSVRWLLQFVRTHDFRAFGWYRVALGGALLVWLLSR